MNLGFEEFEKLPEAKVFRHLRISAGMKVRELADLVGCNHSLICHYEKGRQPIPQDKLIKLCKVFRISNDELAEYLKGNGLPINYLDECMLLINKMPKSKLPTIYELVKSMSK